MILLARHPSTCPQCREPIRVRDRITWSPLPSGKARHYDCGQAYLLAHPKQLPPPAPSLPFSLQSVQRWRAPRMARAP